MADEAMMNVALSDNGEHVVLSVGDKIFHLNADVVSSLLTQLMLLRERLVPRIDMQTPPAQLHLSVRTFHWAFGHDKGDIAITLPHPGYGWIAYRFSRQALDGLRRDLAIELSKPNFAQAH